MKKFKQFVVQNNLHPADAIVLRKKFFGMVDHFAVFLGWDKYNPELPVFAANYTNGTRYIQPLELENFMIQLVPERIEKFNGSNLQRRQAIARAMSKIGENNYSYFDNNCEHYKSYVQTGVPYSSQVENFKEAATIAVGTALLIGLLGEIFD